MKKYILIITLLFSINCHFSYSQTQVISGITNISSNITYSGEALVFQDSGILIISTGSTVIVNTKLLINKKGPIFSGGGTVLFGFGSVDCINPVWFGAIPNDGIDDTEAFLKCRDAVCVSPPNANRGVSKICIPTGVFRCASIPFFQKDSSGSNEYTFITVTIEGSISSYSDNMNLGAGTVIQSTDTAGFVFGFQNARNCTIRNVFFKGLNDITGMSLKNMIEGNDDVWKTICRDDVNSPHAAIVIDPFHKDISSIHRYSQTSGLYTNSNKSGSSFVTIEGCRFWQFVVGIIVSPTGLTTNGDNITVSNSVVDACKVFWAVGQSQARSNSINNVYSVGHIKFFMDAGNYGEGVGDLPVINNCNLGPFSKYVFYSSGGEYTQVRINNSHCEGLYGIGYSKAPNIYPHSFINSTFRFIPISYFKGEQIKANPSVLYGNVAGFYGCQIGYKGCEDLDAGITHVPALNFNVEDLLFSNCTINTPTCNSITNFPGEQIFQVKFENTFISCDGGFVSNNYEQSGINPANLAGKFMVGGTVLSSYAGDSYTQFNKMRIDFLGNNMDLYYVTPTAPVLISVDEIEKECSFACLNPGLFQINDLIVSEAWNSSTDEGTQVRACIGYVKAINGNVIKIGGIPYGLIDNTSHFLYCLRFNKYVPETFGDLTAGSPTIQNCIFSNNQTFLAGDKIKGVGISEGTYVMSVSANTINLSTNSTATGTNIFLYDATRRKSMRAASLPVNSGWSKGDVIFNNFLNPLNNSISQWVCISGGIYGTTLLPVWKAVPIQ